MREFNFFNRGQILIGIIIVLVTVGLITGGLYYYLQKQIPEISEIIEKTIEEVRIPSPEEKPPEEPQPVGQPPPAEQPLVEQPSVESPTTITKKILLLIYNPILESKPGSPKLTTYLGWSDADFLTQGFMNDIAEVSGGFVNYVISERIEVDGFPPMIDGFTFNDDTYLECVATRDPTTCHTISTVDYVYEIETYGFCDKLNTGLIDEAWVFGGPWLGYYESRLTGPGAFWYNSPPLSGTSCSKLLPMMGFNYERGFPEMLESYGHRVESVMRQVYGSWTPVETHAWNRFTLLDRDVPGRGGVGNAHNAVNASPGTDYNRTDTRFVSSNTDDWYNYPNMTGKRRDMNCTEWSCDGYLYLKWWYDHMPRVGGTTDGILNNWWRYIVDYNNT